MRDAMLWSIICGIIFIIIGVLAFARPDFIWEVTEKWKSCYADGPSDLYRLNTRLGGVIFAVLGIAALILPFIL